MLTVVALMESTAVLTLAVLCLAFVGDRVRKRFWLKSVIFGVSFGSAGLIGMIAPVEIQPGFYVDARSVVMALSAAVSGPVSALITGVMLSAMRYYQGGEGVPGGIASLWSVAPAAVAMWAWLRYRGQQELSYRNVMLLATLTALAPLTIIYFFTWDKGLDLSLGIAQTVVPTNFFGVLVIGALIVGDVQRRWALNAHAEGRAQLQSIASNAPCVLFQFHLGEDAIARFLYVSEGATRILGISPEEVVSKPGTVGRMLSPAGLELFRQRVRESETNMLPWTVDLQFTVPDGRVLWMRVSAAPRLDANQQVIWDGSLIDVTEAKEVESMKTEFVSTVSHELRTPLTSIRGSLGLVAGGAAGELPEKARGLVNIAVSNCERLVRLINDILDIEKIESGRMPFDVHAQRLRPLIELAIESGNGYMPERNVSVVMDDHVPDAVVNVDADRLHQVMTNLLSNAVKFSHPDGTVTVRTARVRNGQVRISVRDRGTGIPDEFRSRVFGRFEQADGSGTKAQAGTGLGLNITKAIVERLGGAISFDSERGIGTIFYVDLPEVTGHRRNETSCEAPARVALHDHGNHVLVCEDDADVSAVLVSLLKEEGMECDVATDIAAASAFLREKRYMAMTLDIRLAGESGLTVFRELRSSNRHMNLPVIVISGYVDDARRTLNGAAIGIVDWLEKPIDMERLRAAIRKVKEIRENEKPSVLHVEDDEDVLHVMAMALGEDVDVTFARTFGEAREMLLDRMFDVVVLDLDLPDGWGADLLSVIPQQTAVVVFSASEIEGELAERVEGALIKTRMSEIAIADIVKNLTAERHALAGSEAVSRPEEVR